MTSHNTIAAVDLGSNSFRLQVARVVDDQIYPLDSLKDTVRFGAGLDNRGMLDEKSQTKALAALSRFSERLRGMDPASVRAVATNTLRVARNAAEFLPKAEAALGFPIEVIAGREEARLIYLGASHSLPLTREKRLVVDIGGGSTEFIIGQQFKSQKTESLLMGCVSYSLKYFPDGKLTKQAFREAELAARNEVQSIAGEFQRDHWQTAIGTSGTARSLSDIMELNGLSAGGITLEGMEKLRSIMLKAGQLDAIQLNGLRPDRRPVLPGGFAIMSAVFAELGIEKMSITLGALRDGVLYDLVGRQHQRDMRDVTVTQFKRRYHVDLAQSDRVSALCEHFYRQLCRSLAIDPEIELPGLLRAAKLHEIGLSVSHTAYHKHSAYILQHADMPGFSSQEQARLAQLVLAHRGGLKKLGTNLPDAKWAQILSLRLAVLMCRSRIEHDQPALHLEVNRGKFTLSAPDDWLTANPLTHTALMQESAEWRDVGIHLNLSPNFDHWS
ncbi:exopolyphosphatase [Parachitinimonas caeni]|uniref:Exopolyphosphatase n=1 Tax=Parachitinimonas caeni TaxID=3031301 RepID=A0ABT7DS92_9NEIS|nr:exopolyphosphatase [Parachitinimonas caeni]MDK2122834.1 exopolyphosphatase [Parachitinimonas caeni]